MDRARVDEDKALMKKSMKKQHWKRCLKFLTKYLQI